MVVIHKTRPVSFRRSIGSCISQARVAEWLSVASIKTPRRASRVCERNPIENLLKLVCGFALDLARGPAHVSYETETDTTSGTQSISRVGAESKLVSMRKLENRTVKGVQIARQNPSRQTELRKWQKGWCTGNIMGNV